MTIKPGIVDVQIDTECTSEPGTIELEAFAVSDDGTHTSTELGISYGFLRIPSLGYEDNVFIESTQAEQIAALPQHVRVAHEGLTAAALAVQERALSVAVS